MNKCSLKIVSPEGRRLHGTAAILHMTSQKGGFDAFIQKFAESVARDSVAKLLEAENKTKLRRIK